MVTGFVQCALSLAVGDENQARSLDWGVGENIVQKNIENAQFIVSGRMLRLLKREEGYDSVAGKKVKGYWFEIAFRKENVMKGEITAETIAVRFFLPNDMSSGFVPPPPDGNSYILFLEEPNTNGAAYSLSPSTDPLVQTSDERMDFSDIHNVTARLGTFLERVIVTGMATNITPAVEMLMAVSEPKERLPLLKKLTDKPPVGFRGIILAYRLSFGDASVLDGIDRILKSGKASREEMDVIATTIFEAKDVRLKPFLMKWISCDDQTVRQSAYRTLVTFEDSSLVPVMISALDQDDSLLRLRALTSLSKIVGPRKMGNTNVPFTRENNLDAVNLWKQWWTEKGKANYGSRSW